MANKKTATFGTKYKSISDYDEPVNLAVREHIDTNDDWEFQGFIEDMHQRAQDMIGSFFPDDEILPTPIFGVEGMQKNRYATFLAAGRNEIGLTHCINFNSEQMVGEDRPYWHIMVTLLQQMTDLWQHIFGDVPKTRVKNTEFISLLNKWGIVIHKTDYVVEVNEGPFTEWLKSRDIDYELPYISDRQTRIVKDDWSCKCETFKFKLGDDQDASHIHCNACETDFFNIAEAKRTARESDKETKAKAAGKKKAAKAKGKKAKTAKKPKKGSKKGKAKESADLPTIDEMKEMKVGELRSFAKQFDVTGKSKEMIIKRLVETWNNGASKPSNNAPKTEVSRKPKTKLTGLLANHFTVFAATEDKDGFRCDHCKTEVKSKSGAKVHLKKEHPDVLPAQKA